jgi:hypothetical protein
MRRPVLSPIIYSIFTIIVKAQDPVSYTVSLKKPSVTETRFYIRVAASFTRTQIPIKISNIDEIQKTGFTKLF